MKILANLPILLCCLLLAGLLAGRVEAVPDAIAWNFWNAHGEVSQVDHTLWQQFLDRHLVATADGINRVRYGAVNAADRASLATYIAALAALDPRAFTRPAQQAYWINLYNALTVQVVLAYPRKRSILRMGRKLLSIGPWDDELVQIAGHRLTLNDIEHRILRPLYRDERVHFAVNCASLGCPNLANRVYTADNLDTLLERQMQDYLTHPRGLRLETGKLIASSLFDWYRADFANDERGLRDWLAKRRPALAAALANPDVKLDFDYDWALNKSD